MINTKTNSNFRLKKKNPTIHNYYQDGEKKNLQMQIFYEIISYLCLATESRENQCR